MCDARRAPAEAFRLSAGVILLLLAAVSLCRATVIAQSPPSECETLRQVCLDHCQRLVADAVQKMCYPHGGQESSYSGCALDVVGCSNPCDRSYHEYWCSMPGYIACAQGPTGGYVTRVDECNAKARAAETWGAKLGVLQNCHRECYEPYEEAILACRNDGCAASCMARGYSGGEWANYNSEAGGWDRCACLGDAPTATPTATLTPIDVVLNCFPWANEQNERTVDLGGYAACSARFSNPNAAEVRVWWTVDSSPLTTYLTNVSDVTHDYAPTARGRYWLQAEVRFPDGRSGRCRLPL